MRGVFVVRGKPAEVTSEAFQATRQKILNTRFPRWQDRGDGGFLMPIRYALHEWVGFHYRVVLEEFDWETQSSTHRGVICFFCYLDEIRK